MERRLTSPAVDEGLREKYEHGVLKQEDVFVWSSRTAVSGTVIIARKGNIALSVSADPGIVGGLISMATLGAGATFGGGTQASFQFSGEEWSALVQVKSLRAAHGGRGIQGFEPESPESGSSSKTIIDVRTAGVLANFVFKAPVLVPRAGAHSDATRVSRASARGGRKGRGPDARRVVEPPPLDLNSTACGHFPSRSRITSGRGEGIRQP
jgi:hypothetical protein